METIKFSIMMLKRQIVPLTEDAVFTRGKNPQYINAIQECKSTTSSGINSLKIQSLNSKVLNKLAGGASAITLILESLKMLQVSQYVKKRSICLT